MSEEKFDGLFMTAVQQSQGIENFFTNLFSFMRRKTDFFTFEDKARGIVNTPLNEHMKIFHDDKKREALLKQKQEEEKRKKEQEDAAKRRQGESTAQVEEVTEEEAQKIMEEEAAKKAKASDDKKQSDDAKPEGGDADDGDEESKEKSDKQKPLPGNGGFTHNYMWSQTLEEVTVLVQLPDSTEARNLDVKIQSKKLCVGIKGQPTKIIEGEFPKKVKVDDSLWSIEKDGTKRTLQLNLTKSNQMEWWDCVIEGDPKIDTQKIEPENSKLSDLDGDTRGVVEKMMFDQQQKQKGLPTSEEQEKKNKLAEFMKAHPEMDFSKAKFC